MHFTSFLSTPQLRRSARDESALPEGAAPRLAEDLCLSAQSKGVFHLPRELITGVYKANRQSKLRCLLFLLLLVSKIRDSRIADGCEPA